MFVGPPDGVPCENGGVTNWTRAVLAPSDLEPTMDPPAEVRVGGRVLAAAGEHLTVGDAYATLEVALDRSSAVQPGDLVVIAGTMRGAALVAARVLERFAPTKGVDAHDETARLVRRGVGPALAARAAAVHAVRDFFDHERFLEVETPLMVPSPGLDLHLDAFAIESPPGDRPLYLITSPEYQMKRLLAGGVPRCFQIAHCFRRGERGARHNPEFTMVEWYRAFASVEEVIADTERLVRSVVMELTGGSSVEVAGARVDVAGPFQRWTVAEAFARHAGIGADEAISLATSDEERFFRTLVDTVEPALAREARPVVLTEYPAPFASLARLSPRDPRVSERFELYLGGIELCNGFGELTDPCEQRARLERDRARRLAENRPAYAIDERFLAALEEGIPPAAGNALGLDRLVAICVGAESIGAVQAFPIDWL